MLIRGHEVKGVRIIGVCSGWNDCFCLAHQKYSLMNKNMYKKGKKKKKGAERTGSSTEEWEVSFQPCQDKCSSPPLSPAAAPQGHHHLLESAMDS